MIVDAHIHVWSPNRERYPYAPGFSPDDPWLPSFSAEDHDQACSRLGCEVRVNLVQMTWYGLDHSYICDLIGSDPTKYVGTGIVPARADVSLPAPDQAMRALAERGVRAFRLRGRGAQPAPQPDTDWLQQEGYERMFACAGDEGLILSFLTGSEDLPAIGAMCERFPQARVIIDHVGGVRVREGKLDEHALRCLTDLAQYPQTYVKMGPLHALGDGTAPYADLEPMLRAVVDAFGADRCMWETDCGGPVLMDDPVTVVTACADAIRDATYLTAQQKQHILCDTALRLFWDEGPGGV